MGRMVARCKARRVALAHCSLLVLAALCAAPMPAMAAGKTLLVLGDSLSAEYGLARGTGWVVLLQKQLARDKPGVQVINASISGDTTSGGQSGLPADVTGTVQGSTATESFTVAARAQADTALAGTGCEALFG